MSSKPVVLFEAVAVPAAETEVYVSPVRTLSLVEKFTGCNTNPLGILVTVKVVPAGGAPGAGNVLVDEHPFLPGETYGFPEIVGHKLAQGDSISVLPSDTGLVMRGSGTHVAS
jgi:hypothetical protein